MGDAKRHVLSAIRSALKPIAQLALRNGIQFKDFAAVFKGVLVEAAEVELEQSGTRAANSKIALVCGVDRKEVALMRREAQEDSDCEVRKVADRTHRITRILAAWHRNVRYLDCNGEPVLLFKDMGSPNLRELVGTFAGDIPFSAIVTEMLRANAIKQQDDGSYQVLCEAYLPLPVVDDAGFLVSAGAILNDVGRTVLCNLYRSNTDRGRFEKRMTERVKVDEIAEFEKFVRTLGDANLKAANAWFRSRSHNVRTEKSDESGEQTVRVGLGIYLIQGESHEFEIS